MDTNWIINKSNIMGKQALSFTVGITNQYQNLDLTRSNGEYSVYKAFQITCTVNILSYSLLYSEVRAQKILSAIFPFCNNTDRKMKH